MFRRAPFPLLILSCALTPAHANEESLYFSDLPVVASVSRLPQKISEAPASVTVIDQEMIKASGARTVEDLMRFVPGFQVTSHHQDPAIVTYHGLNTGLGSEEYGPRLQVLIDGRSQYSALFKSGVNWNLLPVALENIERIEVTRSSNTVSYGSNAVMGVINIITLDPAQTRGWMMSLNHGNNQLSDQTLRWGGGTENVDLRFTTRFSQDGGFQLANYNNSLGWINAPDTRRNQLLDLQSVVRLGNRDELKIGLSQVDNTAEYGRIYPAGSALRDPFRDMQSRSRNLSLQWLRTYSPTEEMSLQYVFTQDWASDAHIRIFDFDTKFNTNVTGTGPQDNGGRTQVHELEFTHRFAPFSNTRAAWGSSLKDIAVYSPAQFSSQGWQRRQHARLFSNIEYKPSEQWTLNVGGSLEHDTLNKVFFDPRVSLAYHPTPDHTIRLLGSRAHRTPSLYEARGLAERWGLSNGQAYRDITYRGVDPNPEQIDTLEVGYLGQFKALQSTLDVRFFIEKIPNRLQMVPHPLPISLQDDQDRQSDRDFVDPRRLTYPYGRADSALNIEQVRIHGYEYQWQWRPFETTRLLYNNALIAIEADFIDRTQVVDSPDNQEKIPVQTRHSAPLRTQSAMLIQNLGWGMQASVMYYRSSPMRWRRNGGIIQASERFDWRIAKAFKVGEVRAELAYTAQMINENQEGRQANQINNATAPSRLAEKLHWVTLRLDY